MPMTDAVFVLETTLECPLCLDVLHLERRHFVVGGWTIPTDLIQRQ